MRVIAGTARRLQLNTVEGKDVRPTTDRIKETLFNIIQDDVLESRFLDLFAGSGSIGIEALSRGAREASFVDSSRKSIKVVEHNIRHTKFIKQSTVLHMDYSMAIKRLRAWGKQFDIIYVDPPYFDGLYESILKNIKISDILAENGIIILEVSKHFDIEKFDGYEVYRIKDYKTNKHLFIREVS